MAVADSDFVEALVEDARPTATLHLAHLEHPWLGLESFREETRAYFFGRDTEIAELHLRLRSHPLLVLYGRSGLGKTSILMAGLLPRLRAEEQRPLLLRLRYGDPALDVYGQLVAAVFGWGDGRGGPAGLKPRPTKSLLWTERLAEKLNLPLPDDLPSRLWLRLHYRNEPPDITHLILDQFEEVFTLGALRVGTEHEVRDALAIILQGAIPEPISRLIAEHDVFLDHFDPDSIPVRVILALRNDYVYALNRWKRHLPGLGQNNFELRALRGSVAFDAVFKPGELRCKYRGAINEQNKVDTGLPPIVSKETAERIVRFVAGKDEDVPLEEIEAVPPILSLLCRELNERRFTEPGGTPEMPARQITFRESDADVETIIKTFYERCLAGQPEGVRMFIEEGLVSYSGARLAQDEKSILSCFEEGREIPGAPDGRRAAGFGDAAKARECLKDLVNQRLLTSLGGGDNPNYELIHDLLAAVAVKSRTAREERYEKEQADLRAEADRKAKDAAEAHDRVTRHRARLVSVALVVAIIAAIFGFTEYYKERAASAQAVATRQYSNSFISFMNYSVIDILNKVGRPDLLRQINVGVIKYYRDHPADTNDLEAMRTKAFAMIQDIDLLRSEGQLAETVPKSREALQIFLKLGAIKPDNLYYQRDISLGYERVGDVLRDQGDVTGALKNYQEGFAIAEKLVKQDRDNANLQRDLSVSYGRVGDVLRDQEDLAGALKSYGDSLAIAEKLAKQDPSNAGWQRDLSVSYIRVGDVQVAQGDLDGALKSYGDSLAIAEKLAKQDPGNAVLQRDLSISYSRVGDVQRAQGDLAKALKSCGAGLAIAEKLSKQDPDNACWQRDLSASYRKLGDVQSAQEDLAGALKSYGDSLAIAEKLSKQDPGNPGWQSDLSVSYIRVGDVQRAQGDLAKALKSCGAGLAIAENAGWQRYLSLSPDNANRQGDLAYSCWRTGATLAAEPKSKIQAREMVEKGRDILRQLKQRTGLTAQQQKWLDEIEVELQEMQKDKLQSQTPRK